MADALDPRKRSMLRLNQQQKLFYEGSSAASLNRRGNIITRAWRWARRRQQQLRAAAGVDREMYRAHKEWMGPLSAQSVLDLGCYTGNPLSAYLAKGSRQYLGIDLSGVALQEWQQQLELMGLQHAETLAVDVLEPTFLDDHLGQFDLIYAHSVLHHFEHLEVALEDLRSLLKPGGKIITLDPMEGKGLMRFMRRIYRPFQSDRAWEHPFGPAQLEQIRTHFEVVEVMGLMGRLKWVAPVFLLGPLVGKAIAKRWLKGDLKTYSSWSPRLRECLQLSLCLRRPS